MTSATGLEHDADLPRIVAALNADGGRAEAVAWDASGVAWDAYDLAVVRSVWDYSRRLDEFLGWVGGAARATRLLNPEPVVRWSVDKRYLRDLAGRGVPVVPTRFVEPGDPCAEEDFVGTGAVVVKPSVSAGARDTARYEPGQYDRAVRHARALLDQGRTVMVQPYLRRVEEGERALVFLDGRFSHAIRKGPLLTEPGVIDNARDAHPGVAAYTPSEAELRLAARALAAVPGAGGADPLLYARVDLALDEAGEPLVMELELLEPNLFLGSAPGAVERFAAAVRRIGG
ncbi:hypothetical protein ABT160_46760 [Streptomyces sp. NPDC001941]|uniref:ATP-grasp domain-containing protein n=1 Tax=Streptomyces sp. NPDC001941 TaxID=3154659 RepID=UPI00332D3B46